MNGGSECVAAGHKDALVNLDGPFVNDGGHCWMVPAGAFGQGDNPAAPCSSHLRLYENGVPLGIAHAVHEDIRGVGRGRYSHWQGWVRFSTSDNSDPNRNGRSYGAMLDTMGFLAHCAKLAALQVTKYLRHIPGGVDGVRGKNVIEVSPDGGAGTLRCLAALGAQVVALDPYPLPWDAQWDPLYGEILASALAEQGIVVPPAVLADAKRVRIHHARIEDLPSGLDGFADVVVSSAVLEHVDDIQLAASSLLRAGRPGALNIHVVDFRDHRDQSRPWEYLLLDDAQFAVASSGHYRHVIGNRQCLPEMRRIMVECGFQVQESVTETFCPQDYLHDFLPRLRLSGTRYAQWPEDYLLTEVGTLVTKGPEDKP